jgi:hypothetical protein
MGFNAETDRAEPDRAEPNQPEPNRAEPNRAEPNRLLQRLGWAPVPEHRSVVVSVPGIEACANLEATLANIRRRQDRLSFLFLPGTPEVRDWLEQRFGGSVLQVPWNNRVSAVAFLLTSRARLLLGVRHLGAVPVRLVKSAYSLGIAIAIVDAEAPDACGLANGQQRRALAAAPMVEWWQACDAAAAARLKASGIAEARIADTGSGTISDADSLLKPLRALMARRPVNRRALQRVVMAGLDHPTWRRLINLRTQRIETLEALRSALGRPETIFCLGNGPSSEDPAVLQAEHDCLFRVNSRWLKRGALCKPDMVFTAQKRVLFTVRGAIFAFQTRRAEGQLVTHQVFNPLCRRMRFATLDRLGVLGGLDWDGLRPTNGAAMIATAVALKPRRIIIAGIDLFSDPSGAYPGDDTTPNAYVLVHDADLERRFIMETLERYDGELIILGKVLSEQWHAHVEASQAKMAVP